MLGACAACFGLGLLIATCFESAFLCGCLGVIMICGGGVIIVRK